ncbi:hypothetical protein [Halarcobacter sp.]|uniref:hypothetical protein n=1 Tax=Halarcobacter sp. TaxID=2321133 RepID=UPI003B00BDEF
MRKIILGLGLGASLLFAVPSSEVDLLSSVTNGEVNGVNLELNKSDMEKANGGYTWKQPQVGRLFHNKLVKTVSSAAYSKSTTSTGSSNNTSLLNRLYGTSTSSYKVINANNYYNRR